MSACTYFPTEFLEDSYKLNLTTTYSTKYSKPVEDPFEDPKDAPGKRKKNEGKKGGQKLHLRNMECHRD